jgi:hypothetical protein
VKTIVLMLVMLVATIMILHNAPDSTALASAIFLGRTIVAEHRLPTLLGEQVFSLPTARWFAEGWLGSLGIYVLWLLGGYPMLVFACTLLAFMAFLCVERRCRERGLGDLETSLALAVAVLCSLGVLRVGGGLLDLVFTALFLLFVERAPRQSALWVIPITALWANASIYGVIAPFWGALSAAGRSFGPRVLDRLHRAGFYCACIATILLTPAGVHVFTHYIGYLHLASTNDLLVWQPAYVSPYAFYFGFLPALIIVACFGLYRAGASDIVITFGAILLSLQDGRYLGVAGIAMGPIIAKAMSETNGTQKINFSYLSLQFRMKIVCLAGLLALSAYLISYLEKSEIMQGNMLSKSIVDNLVTDGKKHRLLCADDRWCNYAVMREARTVRVFTDGREQAYPDRILEDARIIVRVKPGWREKIDAWKISDVMTTEARLVSLLSLLPHWHCSSYPENMWTCEKNI